MPPRLLVLSRRRAEAYEPRRAEICISITNPQDPPFILSPLFKAVLRVAFSDVEDEVASPVQRRFTGEHAREILTFLAKWPDVDQIVIHCMAGMGRSPAVALAITELNGWP